MSRGIVFGTGSYNSCDCSKKKLESVSIEWE